MWIGVLAVAVTLLAGLVQLPAIGAGALLHPQRRTQYAAMPAECVARGFDGAGVALRGWYCEADRERRGTLVYLHGVADNRSSAAGLVQRFTRRGIAVAAYDSRAHGESDGEACTYGYFEKEDLRQVIAALEDGPVVLVGTSLGGAVALQAAVDQPRVAGVVAAEVFSDLKTVIRERVPRFVPHWALRRALRSAEKRARFAVSEVSPREAAGALTIPVLLVHGAEDRHTPPEHSRRIRAALSGTAELILVEGAAHNETLGKPAVWARIDAWIDALLPPAAARPVVQ